ncbi:MAG: 50S ribosomal protein L3 N(5)-glutamine methyltransferase, partial [Hyphomicrobiales bacterium]|nr:50S ribosomal protein L3 N(5)-glutamine methyltransferase [Hyphomicrobiales bacterium]
MPARRKAAPPPPELATLRDFWRHAVSRFREAGLTYGHGTADATDEAAFIVLEGLHLPIDRLEPFLDARLTAPERKRLHGLIEARATTRKPAAYLLGRAYVQGHPFRCDERALVPRSFVAELLLGGAIAGPESGLIDDVSSVGSVLDLCCGGGSIAILAALTFPQAKIDAVDLSAAALALARENVADYGLGARVEPIEGDLFAPVKGRRYDLILTNPPYVDAEAMADLPAEYRAEPAVGLDGGRDGLDLVRRIVKDGKRHLAPGGWLVCEIGEGREAFEAT